MPNNIANKLIVNAKTQAEIKNFLSAIAGIERGETLDIDFEKILPTPEGLEGIDWRHWRITNWGTRWNAYETEMDSCDGSAELYFYTATRGAVPLIKKLVEMFPDLEFHYSYADEVIAYNCGEGYGVDGTISFKFPEDKSDKAMQLYIECWRADWDDFKKTEDGWTWAD